MNTFMQLARSLERKATATMREVKAAERATAESARSAFVKRSSGTMTASQRRLLGYPYSARRPSPGVDPSYINVGSGSFRRAWIVIAPRFFGGRLVSSSINIDSKARFMFGTTLMTARRIDTAVAGTIQTIRRVNLIAAVARGLRA